MISGKIARLNTKPKTSEFDVVDSVVEGLGHTYQDGTFTGNSLGCMTVLSPAVKSSPTPNFLQARRPSCRPTNIVNALKGKCVFRPCEVVDTHAQCRELQAGLCCIPGSQPLSSRHPYTLRLLWYCWLEDIEKDIKNWVLVMLVIYTSCDSSCHHSVVSCCSEVRNGLTFRYRLTPVVVRNEPSAGSRVERIDPLRFLAGCRKKRLNQTLSVLSLSLGFFWCMCCAVN